MKFSYLKTGSLFAAILLTTSFNIVLASQYTAITFDQPHNNSDSLKVESLTKELKKLKPITVAEFKAKFKKEINGFKLTEIDAFEDKTTGSFATVNYAKGSQNIYLMISDGAGPGSIQIRENLINYLEIKKIEEPGDKLTIETYKGWPAYFDYTMFENDGITSINYLEAGRYSIVSSGNNIPLPELKAFLDNINL